MSAHFAVITEVPDPSVGGDGNLAMALEIYVDPQFNPGSDKVVPLGDFLGNPGIALRSSVFALGEIIPVDSDGREFGGIGRKPAKWFVGVDYFDDLEDAISRSRDVNGQ